MNEKEKSEKYFSELAEHRSKGDANEANAEGLIYPRGEPVEATGVYADPEERDVPENDTERDMEGS